MAWPYHFVDLTEAQKQQRRQNLDFFSTVAQLSALIPLLAIQCYFLCSKLATRSGVDEDVPSSPHLKNGRHGERSGLSKARLLWRKLVWRCGEPMDTAGGYLGRRGEVLAAAIWLVYLLVLCFLQTGDDYLHLTKRFGIVAASQLPFHYLLAIKSPYSPITLLTGCTHERLNIIHQLLGRIITILLLLHATFYLNFYVQSGLLAAKVQEAYVICGIVGIISFVVIGTTTLAPIRKRSYRAFYIVHVTLSAVLLPILWFHVSHIRIFVYEAAAIYALNVALRMLDSKQQSGNLRVIPNSSLVEISVDNTRLSGKKWLREWRPGQHGYVALADGSTPYALRRNPFSVVSVPAIDGHLRFVARVLSGNTTLLAHQAKLAKSHHRVHIEGPYGTGGHVDTLLQYDRILFVAGGVGATFVLPLYQQLLSDLSPSKGSYRRQKATFVWIARSMADVTWALPESATAREGFAERMKVYLTGNVTSDAGLGDSRFVVREREEEGVAVYAENQEGIELEERKGLLGQGEDESGSRDVQIYAGRPDLRRLVDRTFSHRDSERVAVMVCGPGGLNRSLRKEVGRWAEKGRAVWFWEEHFAL